MPTLALDSAQATAGTASVRAALVVPDRWRLRRQANAFGSRRPAAGRIRFPGGAGQDRHERRPNPRPAALSGRAPGLRYGRQGRSRCTLPPSHPASRTVRAARMNSRRVVLLITAGLMAGTLQAGPGFWSGNGPFGGVAYRIVPAPGPSGATTLFAQTRSGLYRTIDGGLSWQRTDIGIPGGLQSAAANFVIDDLNPSRLLSSDAQGRVYRSLDGGDSWVATGYTAPSDVFNYALADVPGNSHEVYLAQSSRTASAPARVLLLKSSDGGASFSALGGGLPAGRSFAEVEVDPANAMRVMVGTARVDLGTSGVPAPPSIYLSTDAGATWSPSFSDASAMDFDPGASDIAYGAGDVVYALSQRRVYRSDDNGASWTGPHRFNIQSILPHPSDPLTVLLGSVSLSGGGGIERSLDGGPTGTAISTGLTPNASYTSTLTLAPVPLFVNTMAQDPLYPAPGGALWAATDGGGLYRSVDDGASWQPANEGLAAVNVRALAVHPNPSTTSGPGTPGRRLYAGFGDTFYSSPGLFQSTNLGTTWQPLNNQLRAGQIRALAVDPTTAGLSLADIASSHIYAFGRASQAFGYRNGGLYKSTNGGTTWSTIDATLPTRTFPGGEVAADIGTVRSIVLDPRSCTIPLQPVACTTGPLQRVYATATGFISSTASGFEFTHRVVRSDDAGASWTALDAGLPPSTSVFATEVDQQIVPLPLVISPSNPDVLFVGTFNSYFAPNPADLVDLPTGVFRSGDGGATWTQVSHGLPRKPGFSNTTLDVLAMAMHPADEDILWATQYDISVGAAAVPLYKTVDGGANWTPSSTGLPPGIDLRAILVDPAEPDTLYVSGYFPSGDDGSGSFSNPPGVYKSTDGGATWLSISTGLQARSVLTMSLDPFYPSVLHLGTDSGVWSIEQVPDEDGDGVPDDVENLAPGAGDGNGDGVPDATQGAVGSTVVLFGTQNLLAGLKQLANAKGAGGFITSEVAPVNGDCTQAVDVEAVLAARFGRDFAPNGAHFYAYPRNLGRFEVLDCQAARIDLTFHGADFLNQRGWSFRFYGPATPGDDQSVGWHDISDRATPVSATTWRLDLKVGEPGSFRSGSESILFMGGPACLDERIFEGVFESDWTRPPSCAQ